MNLPDKLACLQNSVAPHLGHVSNFCGVRIGLLEPAKCLGHTVLRSSSQRHPDWAGTLNMSRTLTCAAFGTVAKVWPTRQSSVVF